MILIKESTTIATPAGNENAQN